MSLISFRSREVANSGYIHLCLLVDPVELALLVTENLIVTEPQGNFFLGIFDAVGAVADVAADVKGEITADGARGGVKRVGCTKDNATGLDCVTALPDHSADGATQHIGDKAIEKRLVG